MSYYLNFFYGVMLLRNSPQDLPYSRVLFWLSLMAVFSMGFIEGLFVFSPLKNLVFNVFDLVLLLLFLHFLLSFKGYLSRFWQTVTAFCGVGFVFRVLEFPAYLFIVSDKVENSDPAFVISALIITLLLMYSVFVLGHILKHALSSTMLVGVLLTLSYYIINFSIIGIVFPR